MFKDSYIPLQKIPHLVCRVLLHAGGNVGAEDSPPPVAEKGEPQAGENTEDCERSKRSKPTMFSTGFAAAGGGKRRTAGGRKHRGLRALQAKQADNVFDGKVSSVKPAEKWPRMLDSVFTSTPFCKAIVAKEIPPHAGEMSRSDKRGPSAGEAMPQIVEADAG